MARTNSRASAMGLRAERRRQLHIEQEATRPAVRPVYDQRTGIEESWVACRYGNGEIECSYCQRVIPAQSPWRTCPVCSTKWREEFGPRWFEMEFHRELESDHIHFSYIGGRAGRLLEADDDEEYEPVTYTPVVAVPTELWGIRDGNQEAYLVIRDLRRNRGLGAKAIRTELRRMNAERIAAGKAPLEVPALRTIYYWLERIDAETEEAPGGGEALRKMVG